MKDISMSLLELQQLERSTTYSNLVFLTHACNHTTTFSAKNNITNQNMQHHLEFKNNPHNWVHLLHVL